MNEKKGLEIKRRFTQKEKSSFLENINWNKRYVCIKDSEENILWEQADVEAPDFWSDTAVNIAASKYFHRSLPEKSIKQLIKRVAKTISDSGQKQGYFKDEESRQIFEDELSYLLIYQYGAFNSPVWFNCGLYHEYGIEDTNTQPHYFYNQDTKKIEKADKAYEYPQNSACFIQSVDDSLDSMMKLQQSEVNLFKYGSGSGTNFSKIRGKGEYLSSGGQSSGVISFLRGFDTWAGSIKSGGTTRRSAKMVLLDIDHPDIEEFIQWKVKEEEKAYALIAQGYDNHFTGEAYMTVSGQNSNNSIRVTDEFMKAVSGNEQWYTFNRVDKSIRSRLKAKELFHKIAEAAWKCADPGIQFEDTINDWHTCKQSGRINASNPCSEYLFLDDSACNLASLNLIKFINKDNERFVISDFVDAIKIFVIAMDIIVDLSSYPTKEIAQNSHDYRPLGLGFSNLGGFLMYKGIPYDSKLGRSFAASISSLLSSCGYYTSSIIADTKGCFSGYLKNDISMQEVFRKHNQAAHNIDLNNLQEEIIISDRYNHISENLSDIVEVGINYWEKCLEAPAIRNAQISVIAPTGTIGLFMDCSTTGIEPEFSLTKYKQLADGGQMTFLNPICIDFLLKYLPEKSAEDAIQYIKKHNQVVGAPALPEKFYPIFDCAVGERALSPMSHLLMVTAVQPFISGSISKTVNLPNTATVEDIEELYFEAWDRGAKCIAVYRDGCKTSQPLNTNSEEEKNENENENEIIGRAKRIKLPDTRKAIAHKFSVGGHEVYMHIGLYEDGNPGEVFLRASKEGTVIKGLLDHIAVLISMNLQYGVPLQSIIDKLKHGRFEPYGFTNNDEIPFASSLLDYVGQFLERYLPENIGSSDNKEKDVVKEVEEKNNKINNSDELSDIICIICGGIMAINGTCHFCPNCGESSGCS